MTHDAVNIERKGIPTVSIAHENFAEAFHMQARNMGLPELRLAVMPRPHPSWGDDTRAKVTDDLYDLIVEGLGVPVAPKAPAS